MANKKTAVNVYYSNSVDREREFIRIRDKYTCQICGIKREPNPNVVQRKLDVHHVDESMSKRNKIKGIHLYDRSNRNKLITLCHRCHIRFHYGLIKGVFIVGGEDGSAPTFDTSAVPVL